MARLTDRARYDLNVLKGHKTEIKPKSGSKLQPPKSVTVISFLRNKLIQSNSYAPNIILLYCTCKQSLYCVKKSSHFITFK